MTDMTDLKWEKYEFEDWKAKTPFGDYGCIRNRGGSSVLWFQGEKLGVYGGGSHTEAMAAAEVHYQRVLKDNDPMRDASVEAVARAFCKRTGLDPDANLVSPLAPVGWDARQTTTAQWQVFASHAGQAIAMHLAIKEVLG